MKHKNSTAEQYAQGVLDGTISACVYVRLACQRYFDDLDTCTDRGFYFDREEAQRAINFIQKLKHFKGEWAGRYVVLEPWQQFIVWNIFGWKRANGTRRFRYAYVEVARKNGKTFLAAGIGLYMQVADRESGAEVYSAATTAAQSRICFDAACAIVRNTALSKRLRVQAHAIMGIEQLSAFKPLSSAHESQDGFNPSCAIIDEFHAHRDSGVFDVLKSGLGARRQPLMFIITTAGKNREAICYDYRDNVTKILRGINKDDTIFGIIFTLDHVSEWDDPQMWAKANPNLGVSLSADYLANQVDDAKNRPSAHSNVLTKNLNLWVDAETTWILDEKWVACRTTTAIESLVGKPCWGGLDLASVSDITAYVLLFNENGKFQLVPFFWIPEEALEDKITKGNVNFGAWVTAGYVRKTPGNVVDYGYIKAEILKLHEQYKVQSSAYDRWNSSQTIIDLQEQGVNFSKFGQGYGSMSAPSKQFETLVLTGQIEHFDNPVLRWMLASTAISSDPAGNIKPDKRKSSQKIDGIVATIMALGEWLTAAAEKKENVYEKRGIRSL